MLVGAAAPVLKLAAICAAADAYTKHLLAARMLLLCSYQYQEEAPLLYSNQKLPFNELLQLGAVNCGFKTGASQFLN
jgi:hypothetical protein